MEILTPVNIDEGDVEAISIAEGDLFEVTSSSSDTVETCNLFEVIETNLYNNGWFNAKTNDSIIKRIWYTCYGCGEKLRFNTVKYVRCLPWHLKPKKIKHNIIIACSTCYDKGLEAPKNWNTVLERLEPTIIQYEEIKKELAARVAELEKSIETKTFKIERLEERLNKQKDKHKELEALYLERIKNIPTVMETIKTARTELNSAMITMSEKLSDLSEQAKDYAPDIKECPVCCDKTNISVNVPCGHTMCEVCIHTQDNCFVCRSKVRETIRLHFS